MLQCGQVNLAHQLVLADITVLWYFFKMFVQMQLNLHLNFEMLSEEHLGPDCRIQGLDQSSSGSQILPQFLITLIIFEIKRGCGQVI